MLINYDLYEFSFGVNKEAKYHGNINGPYDPTGDRELTGWEKILITLLVFSFVTLALVAGVQGYLCYKKHTERQHANSVLYQHVQVN